MERKVLIIGAGIHIATLAQTMANVQALKIQAQRLREFEDEQEAEKRGTAFDIMTVPVKSIAEELKQVPIAVAEVINPLSDTISEIHAQMKRKHNTYWPLGKKQGGRKHKKHCR